MLKVIEKRPNARNHAMLIVALTLRRVMSKSTSTQRINKYPTLTTDTPGQSIPSVPSDNFGLSQLPLNTTSVQMPYYLTKYVPSILRQHSKIRGIMSCLVVMFLFRCHVVTNDYYDTCNAHACNDLCLIIVTKHHKD